jgi:hypothetical protein
MRNRRWDALVTNDQTNLKKIHRWKQPRLRGNHIRSELWDAGKAETGCCASIRQVVEVRDIL